MTDEWNNLHQEIAAWMTAGRTPVVWWRDDDAVADTADLRRLIDVAGKIPLGLAVIPKSLTPSLKPALPTGWWVLQHGFAHINHEPAPGKKCEFGPSRTLSQIREDLNAGREVLEATFKDQFLPLFVPPWNRISPDWIPHLTEAGLNGLSAYKDRRPGDAPARLNTHVDVLDWAEKRRSGKAGFIGTTKAVSDLATAFRRRRTGEDGVDPVEPVGILTHHLEHDAATWRFLAQLTQIPGLHWVNPKEALKEA